MTTRSAGANPDFDHVIDELQDLKKLLIVQLLASGVQSSHIAKALRVHKSTISGMVPVRAIQKHLNQA